MNLSTSRMLSVLGMTVAMMGATVIVAGECGDLSGGDGLVAGQAQYCQKKSKKFNICINGKGMKQGCVDTCAVVQAPEMSICGIVTLTGSMVDLSGEPVTGLTVGFLTPTQSWTTTTDSAGQFALTITLDPYDPNAETFTVDLGQDVWDGPSPGYAHPRIFFVPDE